MVNLLESTHAAGILTHEGRMSVKTKFHQDDARKSSSAHASTQAQQERIRRMSVEERIKAALTMGDRYSWLKPAPGRK